MGLIAVQLPVPFAPSVQRSSIRQRVRRTRSNRTAATAKRSSSTSRRARRRPPPLWRPGACIAWQPAGGACQDRMLCRWRSEMILAVFQNGALANTPMQSARDETRTDAERILWQRVD